VERRLQQGRILELRANARGGAVFVVDDVRRAVSGGVQAIDLARDDEIAERQLEWLLGDRLKAAAGPERACGELPEIIENLVAHALAVIAEGHALFFQRARVHALEDARDIFGLAPPFLQYVMDDVALGEEVEPVLGARRCGAQAENLCGEELEG